MNAISSIVWQRKASGIISVQLVFGRGFSGGATFGGPVTQILEGFCDKWTLMASQGDTRTRGRSF